MDAPLALYRRYRPETFAEVIGQDHVTEPLRAALRGDRVHHAYLFSGPRGCGKTTSARILARALNCAEGPTDEPCGRCQSCVSLARGAPGSVDVIEIDAASHGGVDDARDLREQAFFAPVASRYKVYIIDEAHMVTTQGFNALLKLVEEPPPHVKFVFATTEPEKVIGTIRSRTHHYPFRLIPPRTLSTYLAELCELEGVKIEPAALPLVVRAGAGSARDSLSVLDQLIGGSSGDVVTYDLTAALLGFTPDTLLDEVVDAFAAHDGRAVFAVVDKVIEAGQDPRRFTEDLLRRLRDLLIISAVPDAAVSGLVDVGEDQAERLVAQAARFGQSDLSRAADLVATGLTELKGSTAPRLLLELICARVLLPAADDSTSGLMARLDRLEKRLAVVGAPSAVDPSERRADPSRAAPQTTRSAAAPDAPKPASEPQPSSTAGVPHQPPASSPPHDDGGTPASAFSVVDVRRVWPDVVDQVKGMRRATWALLSQWAQVVAVDDTTVTLGFKNAPNRDQFGSSGHAEILRQAFIDVIGQDWRVEVIVDPGAEPGVDVPHRVTRPAVDLPPAPSSPASPVEARTADPQALATAREAIRGMRDERLAGDQSASSDVEPEHDADPDDADVDAGLGTTELLQRELGASVIEEIKHD